ncbi:hypothetical protein ASPZODRAFT_17141 [Penicilliopsis zonata CBS 506.65]|uniref:MARVEL domain-containing protein n=1 Tax=Penicilliopsis zonata CBS 506.65 TaxID=1073090 RepID=A0A1L9SFA0_9EURO|nr:hypothetical protein ASPZODRAFT_17141 [Penicilliopsis zonata CBS 506.65]OJJ45694.1 hypothetical protein ASPZODRAFT_17141 [Penicilliopsis zonata CBS 506.65]
MPLWLSTILLMARILEFAFGLAVIGLYSEGVSQDSEYYLKWCFAVVLGTLAAITAMIYLLLAWSCRYGGELCRSPDSKWIRASFLWELGLCILWLSLFGVFAHMYLMPASSKVANNGSTAFQMREAVWIDLLNLALWIISASITFQNGPIPLPDRVSEADPVVEAGPVVPTVILKASGSFQYPGHRQQ